MAFKPVSEMTEEEKKFTCDNPAGKETHVSQYASWQEQPIELPTDEINVEKAEEVTKELEESGITFGETTLKHLDGTSEPVTVFPYPVEAGGSTFDETPLTYPQDGSRVELRGKTLVQQSMSTLKELTNNPEVQKALESEGLTVDYGKVQAILNADDELASASGLIRPLTPEEANATEGGTCACTDCVEATDNDVDTDTMLIVHDLSERLASLEERIAAFNRKASHKI